MPVTKSAQKALRQSIKRKAKNLGRKAKIKNVVKNYRKLVDAGKTEEAKKLLPQVYKTLDKMAKVNFIKRGKAKRLKSRLTKKLGSKDKVQ